MKLKSFLTSLDTDGIFSITFTLIMSRMPSVDHCWTIYHLF